MGSCKDIEPPGKALYLLHVDSASVSLEWLANVPKMCMTVTALPRFGPATVREKDAYRHVTGREEQVG